MLTEWGVMIPRVCPILIVENVPGTYLRRKPLPVLSQFRPHVMTQKATELK